MKVMSASSFHSGASDDSHASHNAKSKAAPHLRHLPLAEDSDDHSEGWKPVVRRTHSGGASERVGVWTAFAFEKFDARDSNLPGALVLVPYGQSLCVLMRQQYLYPQRKILFRS